jgi:ferritin
MISERLSRMLVEQVGSELRAHQFYMAVAIYFDRQSLKRWAKLWHDQSVEEAGHATKIIDFLIDNDIDFDLPALATGPTHFGSPAAAIQASLDAERAVTKQFNDMASASLEDGDHRSHQFVQWFIEEQVEEERKAQALLDLVNSGINLFDAEPLLKNFE